MPLDPDDPRAPFRQIADDLRALIASGALAPGSRLPSARQMMDRYDVASQTVQSAIRVLRSEGIVRSIQGRGTFVVDDLDPSTITIHSGAPGEVATEYQLLRDRIDQLDGEIDEIRQALSEVVARLPPADARNSGSTRPKSSQPRP